VRLAQLIAQHRFTVADAPPPPTPGPGEVQVRVHAVGICGSDLHNFSEGSVGDTPSVFPMVLGHEPTGTIVGTGERVILEPAVYCYHCEMCRSGRHNLCVHIRFYSAGPDPGFFRDIVNLPEHNVLPLPAGLGFAEGTLFEPLAIALHSMQFVKLTPGETVAVWGCGPIGVLTIAVLRMQGARRIYAIDPVPHRRAMATAYGADVVLAPAEALPEIKSASGDRGVDVAIDCVTRDGSLDACCLAVARGGRVVVTGIPSDPMPVIHFHELRRKEVPLFPVRRSNHETPLALDLLRERPTLFGPLVTHQRPLEAIEDAFLMLEHYRDNVGKAVIDLTAS
jgi:L-iditol 2-dehydrogenase